MDYDNFTTTTNKEKKMPEEILDPEIQAVLEIIEKVRNGAKPTLARAELNRHAELPTRFTGERRHRFAAYMNSAIAMVNLIEMHPERQRKEFDPGWEALKKKAERV